MHIHPDLPVPVSALVRAGPVAGPPAGFLASQSQNPLPLSSRPQEPHSCSCLHPKQTPWWPPSALPSRAWIAAQAAATSLPTPSLWCRPIDTGLALLWLFCPEVLAPSLWHVGPCSGLAHSLQHKGNRSPVSWNYVSISLVCHYWEGTSEEMCGDVLGRSLVIQWRGARICGQTG